MKGLMTMNDVTSRAWRAQMAAIVLTLLILLVGVATTARAQGHGAGGGGGAGKVSMRDFGFAASVGVARGQMVQVSVAIPSNQDRSGRLYVGTDQGVWMSQVNVFDALTGARITSFELRNPTPGIHTFDIGGSGDDILFGGENAGAKRVQLRVEVKFVVTFDRPVDQSGVGIYPPTLELVEIDSGKTTVHVGLVKVGTGTLVLTNDNTY